MSPVMHLLHVLHTRDATCSALNTVCVKTELSAVVESHRDRLRLLWLVLRSEHYCVRTHTRMPFSIFTHKNDFQWPRRRCVLSSSHTLTFTDALKPTAFLPSTTQVPLFHSPSHFLSVCPFSIVQHSRTAHTHTQSGVCVFSSYRLFEINKICTSFQHRQLQDRLLGQRDGVDSVLTSANQTFTKANVCY